MICISCPLQSDYICDSCDRPICWEHAAVDPDIVTTCAPGAGCQWMICPGCGADETEGTPHWARCAKSLRDDLRDGGRGINSPKESALGSAVHHPPASSSLSHPDDPTSDQPTSSPISSGGSRGAKALPPETPSRRSPQIPADGFPPRLIQVVAEWKRLAGPFGYYTALCYGCGRATPVYGKLPSEVIHECNAIYSTRFLVVAPDDERYVGAYGPGATLPGEEVREAPE